jgi:hypothetical protein
MTDLLKLRSSAEKTTTAREDAQAKHDRAREERDALMARFADDSSDDNHTALRAADDRVRDLALYLEAANIRATKARDELARAERADGEARLAGLLKSANHETALRSLSSAFLGFVALDRQAAPLVARVRETCAAQREALADAKRLAADLGVPMPPLQDLTTADVATLAGVLVHDARRADGRDKDRLDAFVTSRGPHDSAASEQVPVIEWEAARAVLSRCVQEVAK